MRWVLEIPLDDCVNDRRNVDGLLISEGELMSEYFKFVPHCLSK